MSAVVSSIDSALLTRGDVEVVITEIPGAVTLLDLLVDGHAVAEEPEAAVRLARVLVGEVLPARVLQRANSMQRRT